MSGQKDVVYIEHGGLKRRYVLYRPDSVVLSGELVPAVVMLDGRGGTPWTAMKTARWNQKADAEGFVVVYPEATRLDPSGPLHFLTNPQMWNAGGRASDSDRPEVDDIGFLERVFEDLPGRARVDRSRIYLTGFSNGAAMTYRFALGHPGLLAAIAPVSGHLPGRDHALAQPVPMISFFGQQDPLSPYAGGEVELPWGKTESRPPVIRSVHAWAQLCGHQPEDVFVEETAGLERIVYGQPGARDEVVFIGIRDLGHVWPGGHRLLPEALVGASSNVVSATDDAWAFFARHSLLD